MNVFFDIYGHQRMKLTDFADSWTFPLEPPAGGHFLFKVKCLNIIGWTVMKFGTAILSLG